MDKFLKSLRKQKTQIIFHVQNSLFLHMTLLLPVILVGIGYLFHRRKKKPVYDEYAIQQFWNEMQTWASEHHLPIDHNLEHFSKVFEHALQAIRREVGLNSHQLTCILLAALGHDLDDLKLGLLLLRRKVSEIHIGDGIGAHADVNKHLQRIRAYPNAYSILMKSGCKKYADLTLEMISLVSTSANGNRDVLPENEKWKYIPRECDRLEALGMMGVRRVATGTYRGKLPFRTPETPLPLTVEAREEILKNRPLEKYLERKGKSSSTLDHYYDKLLHLHVVLSGNSYIEGENRQRMAEMSRWLSQVNYVLNLVDMFEEEERCSPPETVDIAVAMLPS